MNLITKIRVNSWVINTQYAILNTRDEIASTTVEGSLQIRLFMQNKPNFRKSQMNVSDYMTREYENMDTWWSGKNKPNSNPIQSQFKPNQSQNKPNTKPNKPNLKAEYGKFIDECSFILYTGVLYKINSNMEKH